MHIRYYHQNGRVGIAYRLEARENDIGFVPKDIQSKGKEAIEEYAVKICLEHNRQAVYKAKRDAEQRKLRQDSVDRLVENVANDGTALAGRILSNDKGYGVRVFLEKPYKSEKFIIFNYPTCWAAAMSGRHVFDDDGNLTENVIKDARDALVGLYNDIMARKKYGQQLDLVRELNGKNTD